MISAAAIARFWAKVDKTEGQGPRGDCWTWTGYRDGKGYGRFSLNGKIRPANRVAYIIKNGSIPDDMLACHRCDYPPCCRPDHIFAASSSGNTQDAIKKGRFRIPVRLRSSHCQRGHAMTGDNVIPASSRAGRKCRECRRLRDLKRVRPPAKRDSISELRAHNISAARAWTALGVFLDIP